MHAIRDVVCSKSRACPRFAVLLFSLDRTRDDIYCSVNIVLIEQLYLSLDC